MPDIKNNNINKVEYQNVITDKGVEQQEINSNLDTFDFFLLQQ